MELKKSYVSQMTNWSHVAFHRENAALINKEGPQKLEIDDLYRQYIVAIEKTGLVAQKRQASSYTKELIEKNHERNIVFASIRDIIHSKINHFDTNIAEAAYRVSIFMKGFGNVTKKPYVDESSKIDTLVNALMYNFYDDIVLLDVKDHVTQLNNFNNEFRVIWRKRLTANSQKPRGDSAAARKITDQIYYKQNTVIEAGVIKSSDSKFRSYINKHNDLATKFRTEMAKSKSKKRRNKNDGKTLQSDAV